MTDDLERRRHRPFTGTRRFSEGQVRKGSIISISVGTSREVQYQCQCQMTEVDTSLACKFRHARSPCGICIAGQMVKLRKKRGLYGQTVKHRIKRSFRRKKRSLYGLEDDTFQCRQVKVKLQRVAKQTKTCKNRKSTFAASKTSPNSPR